MMFCMARTSSFTSYLRVLRFSAFARRSASKDSAYSPTSSSSFARAKFASTASWPPESSPSHNAAQLVDVVRLPRLGLQLRLDVQGGAIAGRKRQNPLEEHRGRVHFVEVEMAESGVVQDGGVVRPQFARGEQQRLRPGRVIGLHVDLRDRLQQAGVGPADLDRAPRDGERLGTPAQLHQDLCTLQKQSGILSALRKRRRHDIERLREVAPGFRDLACQAGQLDARRRVLQASMKLFGLHDLPSPEQIEGGLDPAVDTGRIQGTCAAHAPPCPQRQRATGAAFGGVLRRFGTHAGRPADARLVRLMVSVKQPEECAMHVNEVMTRDVKLASPSDSLQHAAQRMEAGGFRQPAGR